MWSMWMVVWSACPSTRAQSPIGSPFPHFEDFEVHVELQNIHRDTLILSTSLEFVEGSWVYSPLSADHFYGHLRFGLDPNAFFSSDSTSLMEIPPSLAEIDPWIHKWVRVIREPTTFTQKLIRTESQGLDVGSSLSGMVEFVLEPQCLPYEVIFSIEKSEVGTWRLTQGETRVAHYD